MFGEKLETPTLRLVATSQPHPQPYHILSERQVLPDQSLATTSPTIKKQVKAAEEPVILHHIPPLPL